MTVMPTHTTRQTTSFPLHPLHTTLHQQPPLSGSSLPFQHTPRMADAELSVACMDRLEAAMAKLAAAQLCFAATQASMESKLDVLLLKLPIPITSHHYPSSSFVQSTPPSPPSIATLPPMPIPFPCPAPMQPSPAPLPAPLPIAAFHHPTNSKPHTSSPNLRWAAIH